MDFQCFILWGEKLTFSAMEDVYFLTRLPFRGSALPVDPLSLGDAHLDDLAWTYFSGEDFMPGLVVWIGVMDTLVHCCIAVMIVRIYRSLATHWISGGHLRIM
jgi:hypothetical protein